MSHNSRNPSEYAAIDDTYNPIIHRINQAIRQRAVNPEGEIDPIPPILVRYAAPPEDLVEKSKSQIESLISAAQVKKGKDQPPFPLHLKPLFLYFQGAVPLTQPPTT